MKILFLRQYNPYTESSASANRFRGLLDGLKQLGHTVDIAVCGGILNGDRNCIASKEVIYLSKANFYSYWLTRLNTYVLKFFYEKLAEYRFKRISLSTYDIIWLTKDCDVIMRMVLKAKSMDPKTFMELNEFDDFYKSKNYSYLQLRRVKKSDALFQKTIKYIDGFGVMTNTLLDYYKQKACDKARFMHLPMTVDMARFNNCEKEVNDAPYIAFCGSIDKSKDGVDILLKAFIKIAEKYPEVKLKLAGFFTYDTPELLQIIKDNGMEKRIEYIGSINRDAIPSFICNAQVLALSRPDSHQAQGGFPTKLGEYLSTANPVCVTKVGEIPDYLVDNESAFLAEPGNVDSFANALERALQNKEKATTVGKNGRDVAKLNFDTTVQAKRLSEFLENLTNSNSYEISK